MFEIQIEEHKSKLISSLQESFEKCSETNCALVCEGKTIRCHKYLLIAFSHHFKSLFAAENPSENSVIVYVTNMKYEHLKVLIESIYYGKLKIAKDEFPELLKSAQSLGFTHFCNTEHWSFTTSGDPQHSEQIASPEANDDQNELKNKVASRSANIEETVSASVFAKRRSSDESNTPTIDLENDDEMVCRNQQSRQSPNATRVQRSTPTVDKPQSNVTPNPISPVPAAKSTSPSSTSAAHVSKNINPQLFSEANCILSRCLELISKPIVTSSLPSNLIQSASLTSTAPSNLDKTVGEMISLNGEKPRSLSTSSPGSLSNQSNYRNAQRKMDGHYLNDYYVEDMTISRHQAAHHRMRSFSEHQSTIRGHQQMQVAPYATSAKVIPTNYPKAYGKSDTESMVQNSGRNYSSHYPHHRTSSVGASPRMFSPINLTQNQNECLNPSIRNFAVNHASTAESTITRNLNMNANMNANMRPDHQHSMSKAHSTYSPRFAQSFVTYGPKYQSYPRPTLSCETPHQYQQTLALVSNYECSQNSVRHHPISSPSPTNHDSSLLSKALTLSTPIAETRQTHSSSTNDSRYLTKDPFQALIVAKAAINSKKRTDDSDSNDQQHQIQERAQVSPSNSNSSSRSPILPSVTVSRSASQTQTVDSHSISKNIVTDEEETSQSVYAKSQRCQSVEEDLSRAKLQGTKFDQQKQLQKQHLPSVADKQLNEDSDRESDLLIEKEEKEEATCENGNVNEDNKLKVVAEERTPESEIQPPFKKRKSSTNSGSTSVTCDACGLIVPSFVHLREHKREKHNTVCREPGCNFEALERSEYHLHLVEVHGIVPKPGPTQD